MAQKKKIIMSMEVLSPITLSILVLISWMDSVTNSASSRAVPRRVAYSGHFQFWGCGPVMASGGRIMFNNLEPISSCSIRAPVHVQNTFGDQLFCKGMHGETE